MSNVSPGVELAREYGNRNLQGNGNITISPTGSEMSSEIAALQQLRDGQLNVNQLSFINPENRREIANRIEILKKNKFDRHDPEDRKKYGELLKAAGFAAKEDMSAMKELADYRMFELNYDVMASPWALAPFQMVNLQSDELPLITIPRSRNHQRFDVYSISIDGESEREQWLTTKDIIQMEMEMLSTDKVRYRLYDLQQGDVNDSDAIQKELRYDLDMKIDELALAQIDAGETETGLRAILSLHPKIVAANIPDGNYLDLNAIDDAGVLSIGKLKTIIAHIAMFGSAGQADEQFQITNIQISPQNIQDPWNFVSMVSGWDTTAGGGETDPLKTVPEGVREQIYNTGMFTNAWGYNFSWTPNPQLAKGRMYIFTNKPIGWLFTKTEFDKMLQWDDRTSPDFAERNYGEMMFKKAMKFYCPDIWKQRYLIVDL